MPSKRDPSKQRRAAQNRAARAALANRKVNASAPRAEPEAPTAEPAAASTGSKSRTRGAATSRANDLPGGRAALLAVLLAGGAAISLLFLKVPVDEDGKVLSTKEQSAREKAGTKEITEPFTEVYGLAGIALGVLPTGAAGLGLYAVRTKRNPRWVTGALFAMVIASSASRAPVLFFPSLAALAVTYYQVRKAERVAQLAARAEEPEEKRDEP